MSELEVVEPEVVHVDRAVFEGMVAVGTALAITLPPAIAQARAAQAAEVAPVTSAAGVAVLYGRYLGLFVGAGLMAGAAVHFPLAPVRYTVMGLVGAVVFALGSLGERIAQGDRARYLAGSLALALGVGMVAGGIQHFEDFPSRGAVLVPLGLLIGLGAFLVRDRHRLGAKQGLKLAGVAGALAVAVWLGLSGLASKDAPAAAGGGTPAAHPHAH